MRGISSKIVLVLLVVAGCHALPLSPPSPLPDAYQMRVGQLNVHSDFKLPDDNRMLLELTSEREYIYDTVGVTGGHEVIDVDLFRDGERYAEFLAKHFPSVPSRRAFFLETDARLAVYAHWSDRMAEDLRHEVAHGYLHAVVPDIPLWLDEGLAEFFEVPQNQNGLNQPHLALLNDMMVHNGWQPDLTRLEKLRDAAQMDQRDYAESWAWVYAMLHSDPEQREVLTSYLAEVHSHKAAKPLSQRLAGTSPPPEQTLAKYLASLQTEAVVK
jgi:hypothetical protein